MCAKDAQSARKDYEILAFTAKSLATLAVFFSILSYILKWEKTSNPS